MTKMETMNAATMNQRMILSDFMFWRMVFSMVNLSGMGCQRRAALRRPAKQGVESGIGGVEVLDQDLGPADDGHEVGVADPARDDVEVEVIDHPGPGAAAQVHARVEPVRGVGRPQRGQAALQEGGHLVQQGLGAPPRARPDGGAARSSGDPADRDTC